MPRSKKPLKPAKRAEVAKTKPPLYLPALPKGAQYTIGCPPLRSSGDVYHILAYLILCQHEGCELPDVLLAYSADENKMHAERGVALARLLGFEKNFRMQKTGDKAGRPESEVAALREHCKNNRTQKIHLIDQKQTTLMVSRYLEKNGRTHTDKVLRKGFSPRIAVSKCDWAKAQLWAIKERRRIAKAAGHKAILLFNCRYSEGANQSQNAFKSEELYLQSVAKQNNLFLWCLNASDTVPEDGLSTNLFDASIKWRGVNLDKMRHILLLKQLLKLPNLVGMVGNTSGTLDIAAFLGHRVYCFHEFGADRFKYVAAQDYRLLLQVAFMAISNKLTLPSSRAQFVAWLQHVSAYLDFPVLAEKTIGGAKSTVDARVAFSRTLFWSASRQPGRLTVKTSPNHSPLAVYPQEDLRLKTRHYHSSIFRGVFPHFESRWTKEDKNAPLNSAQLTELIIDYVGDPDAGVVAKL